MYHKEGRVFTEFFRMYGLALLIICLALGVMWYLGLFKTHSSNTCDVAHPIYCKSVMAVDLGLEDALTISLSASGISGEDSDNFILSPALINDVPCTFSKTTFFSPIGGIFDDIRYSTQKFTCVTSKDIGEPGDPFHGLVTIKYKLKGSLTGHERTSEVNGVIERA